ncbi:hypothetical protein AcW1_009379 [Taiwanofungus camphoratus]|nr:hypothetical protein AcW1_009379 [Antrodia cinnamomea]
MEVDDVLPAHTLSDNIWKNATTMPMALQLRRDDVSLYARRFFESEKVNLFIYSLSRQFLLMLSQSTQTNRNCMPIYSDVHNYAEMQLFFLRPRYELSTKSVVQPNVRTTAPSTSSRNIPRTAQRFHVMLTDLDSTR